MTFGRAMSKMLREVHGTARRWSLRHFWYRMRLPLRRRRKRMETEALARPFAKSAAARPSDGPAIAFGEFGARHGLGRAAAYDIRTLHARHASLTVVDIGPYLRGTPPKRLSLPIPVENVYLLCQPDNYGLVCQLLRPQDIAGAYRVGRWVWETPVFPGAWRFAEALVHEVWAPSEFCASTFRAAIEPPVRVVPHVVTPPADPGIDICERLGLPKDAFIGLAIMDLSTCPERKNPWAHVRAWKAAFKDDPSSILILKMRISRKTRAVLDEVKELAGDAANIKIVVAEMSHDEIAALHRSADVYVSLHRSEGFGLNIYEALLLGKPVVATDWSANAEYGPGFSNYIGVPYKLAPYRDWMGHYEDRDFLWADPLDEAAALALVSARAAARRIR